MSVQTINIHVDDIDSALAVFDQIQVWKSPDEGGAPTPYAEITAPAPTKATIDGSVTGPWNLDGKVLTVTLNGTDPQTVTFTGPDPVTLSQVIAKINATFSGLAKEVPTDTNRLRIESPTTGTASSLLLSGNACAVLGLSTTKVNGKAQRIALTNPTTEYTFRDFDGTDTTWYKTRFYSSLTGTVSSFSEPTQGNPSSVLPGSALLRCFAYLANGAGQPIAETRRARGQTFKVVVAGTPVQREITRPTDPGVTELNLITAVSTAPDPFTIVQAPPSPIRSS